MKTLEKIMKVMTWLAWAAFVYGIATLETPTAASCICLVIAAAWLTTSALLKEEWAGDKARASLHPAWAALTERPNATANVNGTRHFRRKNARNTP